MEGRPFWPDEMPLPTPGDGYFRARERNMHTAESRIQTAHASKYIAQLCKHFPLTVREAEAPQISALAPILRKIYLAGKWCVVPRGECRKKFYLFVSTGKSAKNRSIRQLCRQLFSGAVLFPHVQPCIATTFSDSRCAVANHPAPRSLAEKLGSPNSTIFFTLATSEWH